MKLVILFFSMLFSVYSFSDYDSLTDEQAIELGMTKVSYSKSNEKQGYGSAPFSFKERHKYIADIVVVINKGRRSFLNTTGQTVRIYQNGVLLHKFNASTGSEKEVVTTSGRKYKATTPTGIYRPKRAYLDYSSRTFFGATMDYAVFFTGGIAIHATDESAYRRLGRRASGGCIRLKREDARTINEIIRSSGNGDGRWVDASVEGLDRKLYIDRVKLYDMNKSIGFLLKNDKKIWTYDTAIVVVDNDL